MEKEPREKMFKTGQCSRETVCWKGQWWQKASPGGSILEKHVRSHPVCPSLHRPKSLERRKSKTSSGFVSLHWALHGHSHGSSRSIPAVNFSSIYTVLLFQVCRRQEWLGSWKLSAWPWRKAWAIMQHAAGLEHLHWTSDGAIASEYVRAKVVPWFQED